MLKLLEFLWHGCWHDWQQTGRGNIAHEGTVVGTYYVYRCAKCGRVKDLNVY
jgi:hypothetical protein